MSFSLPKRYNFKAIEEKWIQYWRENKTYKFDINVKNKEIYSIDTPPPFTSGTLHNLSHGRMCSSSASNSDCCPYLNSTWRIPRACGGHVGQHIPDTWPCRAMSVRAARTERHTADSGIHRWARVHLITQGLQRPVASIQIAALSKYNSLGLSDIVHLRTKPSCDII